MTLEEIKDKEESREEDRKETFWPRHGATIGLVALILYVILLAIGTAAEIFKIDSILDWWIFRPPGR